MTYKIHSPTVFSLERNFYLPIDFQDSVPLSEADAILFPAVITDRILHSNPKSVLAEIKKYSIEKKQGWVKKTWKEAHLLKKSTLQRLLRHIRRNLTGTDLPIILFINTDSVFPFWEDETVLFFRTSSLRSTRNQNEYALPAFVPDICTSFQPSKSTGKPSVAFCGHPQHDSRIQLLKAATSHPDIQTDFIYRRQFFRLFKDPKLQERLTQEFLDNIQNNAFTVCSRGAGNFSVRFYETLRAGRIPILLDSEMIFPFEDRIDWSELIICEQTPLEVLNKVLDWWDNKDISEIQRKCREVWVNYLSHSGFLRHLPIWLEQNFHPDNNDDG